MRKPITFHAGRLDSEQQAVLLGPQHSPETDMQRRNLFPPESLLIAIDGGLDFCYRQKIIPAYAVGDFDSVSQPALRWVQQQPTHLHRHPRNKNQSDTELALDLAHRLGSKRILLTGLSGGDPDHFAFNLWSILSMASRRFRSALMIEPAHTIEYLYGPCHRTYSDRINENFSFLPLHGACNLSLQGFLYELNRTTVQPPTTLTLSNTITQSQAQLELHFGEGLAFTKKSLPES